MNRTIYASEAVARMLANLRKLDGKRIRYQPPRRGADAIDSTGRDVSARQERQESALDAVKPPCTTTPPARTPRPVAALSEPRG